MTSRLALLLLALSAGCAASAGSIAELQDEIERCEVDLDLPEDITEEQAKCALSCIDGDCYNLEEAVEFAESYLSDCVKAECDFDLFPDRPEISFGEDEGTLSTTAEELLAKPSGNPNPKTLVGIYEATGSGSETLDVYFLSNDYRVRNEIRDDGIAMAIECNFQLEVGATDSRTYVAFAWSPIEVHDWGIRILENATADTPYTAYGFNAHCAVEIAADEWPFCTKEKGVPDDATTCVTVRNGELTMVTRQDQFQQGTSQGKKIAD